MKEGQKTRSKIEWGELAEKWFKSGISQESFCKREGLYMATFQKRIYGLRQEGILPKVKRGESVVKRENKAKIRDLFTPIKVTEFKVTEPPLLKKAPYCEIQFENGGRIIIEQEESLEALRKIVSSVVLRC